ncbi:MAG: acyl-CoA dehydrogenase family protein [Alphaproteobacteria bacterium]|nr:acyl-CoA dehydrogenase family protein [Alphaproteobacteria bacterium]
MDFSIDHETRLLLETVKRFVKTELQPLEADLDRSGTLPPETARAIFEKSKALGLYGMNMPAKLGGAGLNAVDMCLVEEQTGQTSDILVRRAFGNVYEVLLACDGARIARWLLPAVTGERVCSIAITEPGAGSDAAGIKTQARRDGDGWRLNGQKHFISDGEFSDFFVVSAVTDPDAGARGISLFLVDKQTPGFTVGRNQPMMGLRGTSHVELFFEDVALGSENLLGAEGRGLRLALETLGRIRLAHIGARSVGMAARILGLMTEHARARRQFGQPIGDFQMIQSMLADSAIEINAARLMILNTAWEIDQGLDPREKISMAKTYGAETYCRVADRAVQLFGGLGYCQDLPIERFYRDSRITRIYDGTSEIHRTVIARGLLKDGPDFIARH